MTGKVFRHADLPENIKNALEYLKKFVPSPGTTLEESKVRKMLLTGQLFPQEAPKA